MKNGFCKGTLDLGSDFANSSFAVFGFSFRGNNGVQFTSVSSPNDSKILHLPLAQNIGKLLFGLLCPKNTRAPEFS